ncbi:unnamed protein product [Hydatigera taeniaeformis]|uniref:SERPIN domain-containing protein n=1 Tax=Hydatigena taeniaeformis TaxID=6205 RepID=A0A158RF81_HYDTA|nr:unnamed protein product [Hydatigera taeniaeformis]
MQVTHTLATDAMGGMLLTAVGTTDVLGAVDVVAAVAAGMAEDAAVAAVAVPVFHACGIVEDGLKTE